MIHVDELKAMIKEERIIFTEKDDKVRSVKDFIVAIHEDVLLLYETKRGE